MSNASLSPSARRTSLGVGTGEGTAVTVSATVHAKGAWVTIGTASGPLDRMLLQVAPVTTARFRIDLAFGTAGNEVVIVADLFIDPPGSRALYFDLPIACATGTTILARCSSSTASGALRIMISGAAYDGAKLPTCRGIAALNAFTNTDPTPQVTLNGTTFTPWTEIVASAPEVLAGIMISLGTGGDTARSGARGVVQIGLGAAGVEEVLYDLQFVSAAASLSDAPLGGWLYGLIPQGSRLAARARMQAASTDTLAIAAAGARG